MDLEDPSAISFPLLTDIIVSGRVFSFFSPRQKKERILGRKGRRKEKKKIAEERKMKITSMGLMRGQAMGPMKVL